MSQHAKTIEAAAVGMKRQTQFTSNYSVRRRRRSQFGKKETNIR